MDERDELDEFESPLLGRLQLWSLALFECSTLLKDASRATAAMADMGEPPSKWTPEYSNGPFGTWVDLYFVNEAYLALSAVYFCQLFNRGDGEAGRVADNHDESVKAERAALLAAAFPDIAGRTKFDAFQKQIKDARDAVIAHAEGPHFEVRHMAGTSSSNTHGEALRNIDLDYWRQVVAALDDVLSRRAAALRWELTPRA